MYRRRKRFYVITDMPTYDYECTKCGTFEAIVPHALSDTRRCGACGKLAKKVFLTVRFQSLSGGSTKEQFTSDILAHQHITQMVQNPEAGREAAVKKAEALGISKQRAENMRCPFKAVPTVSEVAQHRQLAQQHVQAHAKKDAAAVRQTKRKLQQIESKVNARAKKA